MTLNKCRLLVKWLLILLILIHTGAIILHMFSRKEIHTEQHVHRSSNPSRNLSLETKTAFKKTDIYFLKVHKTGSSTLQNILYRFAMKEGLRVALFNKPAGMPYPKKPLASFLYEDVTDTHFKPYNIMCDHAVFSKEDVNLYMKSNYVTIALIRDPLTNLRSAFKFWNIARGFRLHSFKDPVKQFLLNNASQYSNYKLYEKCIQNMQAYHFGYTSRSNDQRDIEDFIRHIRSQFDLVLILEKFDESLLLLRRLLHWDMSDIMYIKQFVNKETEDHYEDNIDVTWTMRQAHRAIALADYRLYELFNENLQQQVEKAGSDFQQELQLLQFLKVKLSNICPHVCDILTNGSSSQLNFFPDTSPLDEIRRRLQVKQVIYEGGVKWHKEVSLTLKDCVAMNLWSQHFHTAFKIHQLPQSCANLSQGSNSLMSGSPLSNDWCESSSYLFFKMPLQHIQQYIFGKLTKGPKAKMRPYCPSAIQKSDTY